MKRIVLILLSLALIVATLVSCGSPAMEPPQTPTAPPVIETPAPPPQETPAAPGQTPEPLALTADWEQALADYLVQFPPIFHNARLREEAWGRRWESDWRDFIKWSDENDQDDSYTFRDAITGEPAAVADVSYLNQRTDIRYEDGLRHTWTQAEIAVGFDLFDLEGGGIPALVIYWSRPTREGSYYPGVSVTLHRFHSGAFAFAAELSSWEGVSFYRADDSELFIDYQSTVAHMIDVRSLHLDNEISIEPVLCTDGDRSGTVYNLLTGEYFLRDPDSLQLVEVDEYPRETLLGALLGIPLERIEPMEALQAQFMEIISVRLRADERTW